MSKLGSLPLLDLDNRDKLYAGLGLAAAGAAMWLFAEAQNQYAAGNIPLAAGMVLVAVLAGALAWWTTQPDDKDDTEAEPGSDERQ